MTDTSRATGQNQADRQNAQPHRKLNDRFNSIADGLTTSLGSFWALLASVLLVVIWALTGPIFQFSDTWQLFINTSTTVITFWMVFVIQNSQNRDAKAVHLKLDELIRSVEGARNAFITLERAPEETMTEKAAELAGIAEADDGAPLASPVPNVDPPS
ncbi:MAG TPA: low affinity iron permease family protein [Candidatus Limnocylindrales bacterium]|nr:low affinity iron permease family protein [Candidatus Limnocylindrales bacterium]